MKIRDIMTRDPACCTPDTKLSEVARLMADQDCGEIPVVENYATERPIGVVTDRDIVLRGIAVGRNPLEMTARDVMSSPVVTVRPETPVEVCCQTLEDQQVRRAPVVDERGRCCGIVSQADIARHASEGMTAEVVRIVSQPAYA